MNYCHRPDVSLSSVGNVVAGTNTQAQTADTMNPAWPPSQTPVDTNTGSLIIHERTRSYILYVRCVHRAASPADALGKHALEVREQDIENLTSQPDQPSWKIVDGQPETAVIAGFSACARIRS
jgi:hypothetical protein